MGPNRLTILGIIMVFAGAIGGLITDSIFESSAEVSWFFFAVVISGFLAVVASYALHYLVSEILSLLSRFCDEGI